MKKFTQFKSEKELNDFNDFSASLHDGRILEMKCKLDYDKNKENQFDEIYSLKIKIEGVYFAKPQYKPENLVVPDDCLYKGVELLFEGIEKIFFSPAERNGYLFIFDALMMFKDGKIIFNAFSKNQDLTDLGPYNLYVMAEKLSYRLF